MLKPALIATLVAAALGGAVPAFAQSQPPAPATQAAEPRFYGSELMTPEERGAYREKMRAAQTPEERLKLRDAHRAEMEQRAKEKGVTLAEPRGPRGAGDPRREAYGQLFTEQERHAFREQMHNAQTREERQKLAAEHRALAESRAKEKGITLPEPRERHAGRGGHGGRGGGGVYSQLFTEQERNAFRSQMHSAQTREERQKLAAEHRALAESRATEKGVTLPEPRYKRGPRPAPAETPGA